MQPKGVFPTHDYLQVGSISSLDIPLQLTHPFSSPESSFPDSPGEGVAGGSIFLHLIEIFPSGNVFPK